MSEVSLEKKCKRTGLLRVFCFFLLLVCILIGLIFCLPKKGAQAAGNELSEKDCIAKAGSYAGVPTIINRCAAGLPKNGGGAAWFGRDSDDGAQTEVITISKDDLSAESIDLNVYSMRYIEPGRKPKRLHDGFYDTYLCGVGLRKADADYETVVTTKNNGNGDVWIELNVDLGYDKDSMYERYLWGNEYVKYPIMTNNKGNYDYYYDATAVFYPKIAIEAFKDGAQDVTVGGKTKKQITKSIYLISSPVECSEDPDDRWYYNEIIFKFIYDPDDVDPEPPDECTPMTDYKTETVTDTREISPNTITPTITVKGKEFTTNDNNNKLSIAVDDSGCSLAYGFSGSAIDAWGNDQAGAVTTNNPSPFCPAKPGNGWINDWTNYSYTISVPTKVTRTEYVYYTGEYKVCTQSGTTDTVWTETSRSTPTYSIAGRVDRTAFVKLFRQSEANFTSSSSVNDKEIYMPSGNDYDTTSSTTFIHTLTRAEDDFRDGYFDYSMRYGLRRSTDGGITYPTIISEEKASISTNIPNSTSVTSKETVHNASSPSYPDSLVTNLGDKLSICERMEIRNISVTLVEPRTPNDPENGVSKEACATFLRPWHYEYGISNSATLTDNKGSVSGTITIKNNNDSSAPGNRSVSHPATAYIYSFNLDGDAPSVSGSYELSGYSSIDSAMDAYLGKIGGQNKNKLSENSVSLDLDKSTTIGYSHSVSSDTKICFVSAVNYSSSHYITDNGQYYGSGASASDDWRFSEAQCFKRTTATVTPIIYVNMKGTQNEEHTYTNKDGTGNLLDLRPDTSCEISTTVEASNIPNGNINITYTPEKNPSCPVNGEEKTVSIKVDYVPYFITPSTITIENGNYRESPGSPVNTDWTSKSVAVSIYHEAQADYSVNASTVETIDYLKKFGPSPVIGDSSNPADRIYANSNNNTGIKLRYSHSWTRQNSGHDNNFAYEMKKTLTLVNGSREESGLGLGKGSTDSFTRDEVINNVKFGEESSNTSIALGEFNREFCESLSLEYSTIVLKRDGSTPGSGNPPYSEACAYINRPWHYELGLSVSLPSDLDIDDTTRHIDGVYDSTVSKEATITIKNNNESSAPGNQSYTPRLDLRVMSFALSPDISAEKIAGNGAFLGGGDYIYGAVDLSSFYGLGVDILGDDTYSIDPIEYNKEKQEIRGVKIVDGSGNTLPVGTKICVAVAVNHPKSSYFYDAEGHQYYGDNDGGQWLVSGASCQTVVSRSVFQIVGGDVSTGAKISSKGLKISDKYFGSWTDYGLVVGGDNSRLASGFAGATSGFAFDTSNKNCSSSPLTIANDKCGSRSTGNSGVLLHRTFIDLVNNYFAVSGTTNFDSFVNVNFDEGAKNHGFSGKYYYASNIDSLSDILSSGQSVIRIPSGYGLIIDTDLKYSNSPVQATDIPERIIIVENGNILVERDVQAIDAWLILENGSLVTCIDEIGNKTASDVNVKSIAKLDDYEICEDNLTINGPVVGNYFDLSRTTNTGVANIDNFGERFILSYSTLLWALNKTIGANDFQPNVVYSSNLPPRY